MRGRFITLEGPEGSGKSTHIVRLKERLEAKGIRCLQTREPGGTPAGEAIRHLLKHDPAGEGMCAETETLLFEASRAELIRKIIQPALVAGTWVLCDRFADSTTAYQGYARGMDMARIEAMNAFAVGPTPPDLTVLMDIDVKRAFERTHERNAQTKTTHDRIEREHISFHERVRAGYLDMARRFPDRFRIIDADRTREQVEPDVWAAVAGTFGLS
jgi:dTMP kinase